METTAIVGNVDVGGLYRVWCSMTDMNFDIAAFEMTLILDQ
ncbi:MAG: hypothetical protein AAF614_16510 [Chloroflexota bacterium]